MNTALALGADLHFSLLDGDLTPLDVVGLGVAATMIALVLGRARRNLAMLARGEPATLARRMSARC